MKMPRADRFDMQVEVAVTPDNGVNIFNFSTLNVSDTGMLIASNEIIDIGTSYLQMAIDPLEQHFSSAILCDFQVVRVVLEDAPVELQNSLENGFTTCLGIRIYFRSLNSCKKYRHGFINLLTSA